jgi:hypothetical protein
LLKSYSDFAECVDFSYWWSCIGKGLDCSLRSRLVWNKVFKKNSSGEENNAKAWQKAITKITPPVQKRKREREESEEFIPEKKNRV